MNTLYSHPLPLRLWDLSWFRCRSFIIKQSSQRKLRSSGDHVQRKQDQSGDYYTNWKYHMLTIFLSHPDSASNTSAVSYLVARCVSSHLLMLMFWPTVVVENLIWRFLAITCFFVFFFFITRETLCFKSISITSMNIWF